MKDFLHVSDLNVGQLKGLLALAREQKSQLANSALEACLKGKVLAMIFAKPSLRTRVSFEVGILQLGGQALYLSPAEIGLGERESVADVARVVSRYADAIMARVFGHSDILGLAEHASVPVINGLSDQNHPCQALADLLTIQENFGELAGRHLCYLGDGNNVAHSLMVAGAMSGMRVTILHPEGYAPDESIMKQSQTLAAATDAKIEASSDLGLLAGADVLYTDVWASMGQEEEAAARSRDFSAFQLDEANARAVLRTMRSSCIVCPHIVVMKSRML